MSESDKIATRIALAIYNKDLEYFKNKEKITEKDIWNYLDESWDIFPRGFADQYAPLVYKKLQRYAKEEQDLKG